MAGCLVLCVEGGYKKTLRPNKEPVDWLNIELHLNDDVGGEGLSLKPEL